MVDDRRDPMLDEVRDSYNVPGETPKEQMWDAVSGRLAEAPALDGVPNVIDIRTANKRGPVVANRSVGWAAAAAAILALGIGIGRVSAPPPGLNVSAEVTEAAPASLALAAQEHLSRSESLLTMVRADARLGRVDPMTAEWVKAMLGQTRMLIDVQDGGDPTVSDLLLDLELVLAQILGVAETESMDEGQARTELELALRSLEEGEVLPRIQAVLPNAFSGD